MSKNRPELRFTRRGVVTLTTIAAIGGCGIGGGSVYAYDRFGDRLTHDYGCATTYTGEDTNVAMAALNARKELGLSATDPMLERAINNATPAAGKLAPGTAIETCVGHSAVDFGNKWNATVTVQG